MNNKKFDSVNMMRVIREKVSSDMKDMNPEQILEYLKKGHNEYQEQISRHQKSDFYPKVNS